MKNSSIVFSAPGKIHLLGEHAVVYGKPALLAAVNLRVTVTLSPVIASDRRERGNLPAALETGLPSLEDSSLITRSDNIKKIIEPIIKKQFNLKTIPSYQMEISSQLPIGAGLGSSAAVSAAYITALLTFLKVSWDKSLINELAYEAEKVFHGNPSGGDNSTVIFGGLIWFRKETPDFKIIQPLPFTIPTKIARNFILINTGKPKETTREMVEMVASKIQDPRSKIKKLFDHQEQLTKDLLLAIQNKAFRHCEDTERTISESKGTKQSSLLIKIIKAGERNLEKMGVVSTFVKKIIRQIEKQGGAAKICGGGGKTGPTGVLLCYHTKPSLIQNIAKFYNLDYFKTVLGAEGLRQEKC